MATSRSFGGRLLTTRSPMRISPDVMFSSPAIIRSKVDLPHPEGPTSTTNSPSRIETSTPWMTLVEPNAFRTSRILTEATRFLLADEPAMRFSCLVQPVLYERFVISQSPLCERQIIGLSLDENQARYSADGHLGIKSALNRQPTIDKMRLAGDVTRFIRGQK